MGHKRFSSQGIYDSTLCQSENQFVHQIFKNSKTKMGVRRLFRKLLVRFCSERIIVIKNFRDTEFKFQVESIMTRTSLIPFLGKTCKVFGFLMKDTTVEKTDRPEVFGMMLRPVMISRGTGTPIHEDHLWMWVHPRVRITFRQIINLCKVKKFQMPIPLVRARAYIGCYQREDGTKDIGAVAATNIEIYDPTGIDPDPNKRWHKITTGQLEINQKMIEHVKRCLEEHQITETQNLIAVKHDEDTELIQEYLHICGYPKSKQPGQLQAIKRYEREDALTEGQKTMLRSTIQQYLGVHT
jgi:hypothetical protein